jgi:hypothetical protein
MIRKLIDLYNAIRDSIQDVRREQEEAARTKYILDRWGGVLHGLGGSGNQVLAVCDECSFETYTTSSGVLVVSHSPLCSKAGSAT